MDSTPETISLREQKRRNTKLGIEDAATRLVDEKGFAHVTVEEICAAAGVSKRTFFNYFDSKDSAVLGTPGQSFTPAQRERFLSTPADSMAVLSLELAKEHLRELHADSRISARRHRIANDTDAAYAVLSRRRAKNDEFSDLIKLRLEKDPHLRLLSGVSTDTEAIVIAGIVREALWVAMAAPDSDCNASLPDRLDQSVSLIHDYWKEIQW
ncbi:TetR family transcriptional regulator [Corynebacterium phocae]|uniref:TetR family transcriptional regulator n=1 Tax=Corynebacterium phocae TaxID=161895 RepID=A0A1L7D3Z6_9CORY|nr:TetR/AcrR family transcriptional regulator [Corynebacterium phocae]APT92848.1 TetR family transcriptional regulator [Corynebacterium phocae]KAA8723167.1 TetR family transcriptional regulator [Corynebacterium phocae]